MINSTHQQADAGPHLQPHVKGEACSQARLCTAASWPWQQGINHGVNRPLLAEGWVKFQGKGLGKTHTCPCLLPVCLRNASQECFLSCNLLASLTSSLSIFSLHVLPVTSLNLSSSSTHFSDLHRSLGPRLRLLTCFTYRSTF